MKSRARNEDGTRDGAARARERDRRRGWSAGRKTTAGEEKESAAAPILPSILSSSRDSVRWRRRRARETRGPSGVQSPWSIKHRRHTPTKDRMSLKRCRDQWPGIPFPVSGQRRVTRRSRVTRTRNFSENTTAGGKEGGGRRVGKGADRDDAGRREETERPKALRLSLSIRHVISTKSILLFLHTSECHERIWEIRNICATAQRRFSPHTTWSRIGYHLHRLPMTSFSLSPSLFRFHCSDISSDLRFIPDISCVSSYVIPR